MTEFKAGDRVHVEFDGLITDARREYEQGEGYSMSYKVKLPVYGAEISLDTYGDEINISKTPMYVYKD